MLFLTYVKRRKRYNIGYNIRKGTIPSKSKLLCYQNSNLFMAPLTRPNKDIIILLKNFSLFCPFCVILCISYKCIFFTSIS